MDKRIFLFLIVLVAFTVEAKKKILKKKLNQLKGKETKNGFSKDQVIATQADNFNKFKSFKKFKILLSFENVAVMNAYKLKFITVKRG